MRRASSKAWGSVFALSMSCLLSLCAPTMAARAQEVAPVPQSGAMLAEGWHPYLGVAPAFPLGRLGELTSLGLSGHVGAWHITPQRWIPGVGLELMYATFERDRSEALPGRYQLIGGLVKLTSKGRQRVFYDWLGAYTTGGIGVFRAGTSGDNMRTVLGASASVGVLAPVYGREGFVEARFHHLFSGETLGRGNGLTFAPLVLGVRF